MAVNQNVRIEWAVTSSAPSEDGECGDLSTVLVRDDGALVAAVDGLGHGREAAASARAAIDVIESRGSEPLERLLDRCHERLRQERGAVISLASLDFAHDEMSWIGIGNVSGCLHRKRRWGLARPESGHSLLLRRGVVGRSLPHLRADKVPLRFGDVLILATDGIDAAFAHEGYHGSPRKIADTILTKHGSAHDDALVCVVTYLGGQQ